LIAWCSGRREHGNQLMERAIRRLWDCGYTQASDGLRQTRGRTALLDGDPESAEELLRSCVVTMRSSMRVFPLTFLAVCDALAGRESEARVGLDEAEDLAQLVPGYAIVPRIVRAALDGEVQPEPANEAEAWIALHVDHARRAAQMLQDRR
jgi:hypothetical protein